VVVDGSGKARLVAVGIFEWDSVHSLRAALGCKLCFRDWPESGVDPAAVLADPITGSLRVETFVALKAATVAGFGW